MTHARVLFYACVSRCVCVFLSEGDDHGCFTLVDQSLQCVLEFADVTVLLHCMRVCRKWHKVAQQLRKNSIVLKFLTQRQHLKHGVVMTFHGDEVVRDMRTTATKEGPNPTLSYDYTFWNTPEPLFHLLPRACLEQKICSGVLYTLRCKNRPTLEGGIFPGGAVLCGSIANRDEWWVASFHQSDMGHHNIFQDIVQCANATPENQRQLQRSDIAKAFCAALKDVSQRQCAKSTPFARTRATILSATHS